MYSNTSTIVLVHVHRSIHAYEANEVCRLRNKTGGATCPASHAAWAELRAMEATTNNTASGDALLGASTEVVAPVGLRDGYRAVVVSGAAPRCSNESRWLG